MALYAAESDLQRYTPEILPYINPLRRVEGWVNHAGSVYVAHQVGACQVVFVDGADWGATQATLVAVDAATEWFYDSAADALYIYHATDPNELRVEVGEDASTYMTWILTRGSRLLDSMLDAHLKVPTLRDRSGNYDDVIIQATCYMTAWLATVSQNVEMANSYHALVSNPERSGIADRLNKGELKLSRSMDIFSSCGEIIAETVAGDLHIVDMKGRWTGDDGDIVLVKITTTGAIGTGKFTSYGYDSSAKTLQTRELVSAEVITGMFQHIGGGVEIQFGGDSGDSATEDDQWEIKMRNAAQPIEEGGFNVMEATRV